MQGIEILTTTILIITRAKDLKAVRKTVTRSEETISLVVQSDRRHKSVISIAHKCFTCINK